MKKAHSSVLAWRIPGTAEPGGPPSMGSYRVRHNWSDLVAAVAAAWWKRHLVFVLILEVLIDLHRTVQLQLLQHQWLGHRLGLLWYLMVYLVNKQRSFCCYEIASNTAFWGASLVARWQRICMQCRRLGSIPGSGRSPGWGHGYPLQYSFLENSMNCRAWQDIVHGIAKSQTQLSNWTMTTVGNNSLEEVE